MKHFAATERHWLQIAQGQSAPAAEWGGEPADDLESAVAAYTDGFRLRPEETIDDVFAEYDGVAAETEAVIRNIANLGQAIPVPRGVPWFPPVSIPRRDNEDLHLATPAGSR